LRHGVSDLEKEASYKTNAQQNEPGLSLNHPTKEEKCMWGRKNLVSLLSKMIKYLLSLQILVSLRFPLLFC
jgi:hypothetical protein